MNKNIDDRDDNKFVVTHIFLMTGLISSLYYDNQGNDTFNYLSIIFGKNYKRINPSIAEKRSLEKKEKSPSPCEYKIKSSFEIIVEKGKLVSDIRRKLNKNKYYETENRTKYTLRRYD